MSECEFCHEDHCILRSVYPKVKKCKNENKEGICTATDKDLVAICNLCGINKAESDSEYCKKCNKEMSQS